jgi:hypothetical protein
VRSATRCSPGAIAVDDHRISETNFLFAEGLIAKQREARTRLSLLYQFQQKFVCRPECLHASTRVGRTTDRQHTPSFTKCSQWRDIQESENG